MRARSQLQNPSLLLIACLAIAFQLFWGQGRIPSVLWYGELYGPDDFLRMEQLKSWLGGQGWFDLAAYRIGPAGSSADMHWSRLVDVPLGLLILLFGTVTDFDTAANLAAIVWPIVLLTATIVTWTLVCDRLLDGYNRYLPALLVLLSVSSINQFGIGRIDHHNVQILLFSVMVLGFVSRETWWGDLLLGGALALTVTIGLDTLPIVLVMMTITGVEWAAGLDRDGRGMLRTGLSLMVASTAFYALSFPPGGYFQTYCDANSLFYLAALLLVGTAYIVLYLLSPVLDTGSPASRLIRKGFAGACLAVLVALLLFALFPDCLAGPYGNVSEAAKTRWLEQVSEAKSLAHVLAEYPFHWLATAGYLLAMLAIGLIVLANPQYRTAKLLTLYAVLVAFSLGTLYQVRVIRTAAYVTIPFCVVFAKMTADWLRVRYANETLLRNGFAFFAMVPLVGMFWHVAGVLLFPLESDASAGESAQKVEAVSEGKKNKLPRREPDHCLMNVDYAFLDTLDKGLVLADLSNSMAVLAHTRHRVLAGPYHRNEKLILATLDFLETDTQTARQIAGKYGIDYVAFCTGNVAGDISRFDEASVSARIIRGDLPSWMQEVSPSGARVRVLVISR